MRARKTNATLKPAVLHLRGGLLSLTCALLLPMTGSAATLYVDNGLADYAGHDGASPESAYRRIQEAIDKASDGDTILVAPGVYGDDQGLGRTSRCASNRRAARR